MKILLVFITVSAVLCCFSCTKTKIVYIEADTDNIAADGLEPEADTIEIDTDVPVAGDADEAQETEDAQTDENNDSDTAVVECTTVTLTEFYIDDSENKLEYDGLIAETLGSPDLIDPVTLLFYSSVEDTDLNELTVGKYDLGSETNKKVSTCSECVFVFQDYDEDTGKMAKAYFQQSGTLEITEIKTGTPQSRGTLTAKLIQVSLDAVTQEAIPVPGGDCIEFKASAWDTICVPNCNGRICGPDGCGGFCGDGCGAGTQCSADASACIACTAITLQDITANPDSTGQYIASLTANVNGDDTADIFYIDFYGPQSAATFDLGTGDNAAYATCKQCVKIYTDIETDARWYFQQSGTLTVTDLVTDSYGSMTAKSAGHIDNLRLVELGVEEGSNDSIPLKDGGCLDITAASWNTMTIY